MVETSPSHPPIVGRVGPRDRGPPRLSRRGYCRPRAKAENNSLPVKKITVRLINKEAYDFAVRHGLLNISWVIGPAAHELRTQIGNYCPDIMGVAEVCFRASSGGEFGPRASLGRSGRPRASGPEWAQPREAGRVRARRTRSDRRSAIPCAPWPRLWRPGRALRRWRRATPEA